MEHTSPDHPSTSGLAESAQPHKSDERLDSATAEPFDLDTIHQVLAELSQWADRAHAQGEAEQDAIDKIYYSRLPVALFHATTPERARQIARDGLVPSSLQFEDAQAVSLSDTIAYAKFCAAQTQRVPPTDLVILEVTTQGLDRAHAKSYLKMPNPIMPEEPLHEVHYDLSISSDWIHQLTPAEMADIELAEANGLSSI